MIRITDHTGQLIYEGIGPLSVSSIDAPAPLPQPQPQPQPPGVVAVPWVSQVLNSYRLDCGPAVWTMIARYCGVSTDIDTLIRMMGAANRKTSPEEAIACWQRLGLKTLKGAEITTWPHMSMVHYTLLPERYDPKYVGFHFIVTLGVDERGNVVYHDCCYPDAARGAYKRMTMAQFQAAEVSTESRATAIKP